jgi:uncharacterized Tic20 family protein
MAERYWDSPVKSPSRKGHVHPAVTVKLVTEPEERTDRAWAAASYLSAAVLGFLAPLAIYLLRARRSPSLRRHAAQAANVAITFLLYLVCAAVVSAALAISSAAAGLWTGAAAAFLLWIVTAVNLVRAALAARNGTFYRVPDWLCATLLRLERG